MRRILKSAGIGMVLAGTAAIAHAADNGDGTSTNPPLYADYPDANIIRVKDDFYMVSTTFADSPGLAVLHSMDLVNWTKIGNVVERLGGDPRYDMQGDTLYRNGVFAPSIRYRDGTFYVAVPPNGTGQGLQIYHAHDPAGEWRLHQFNDGAFDPALIFDDDAEAIANDADLRSSADPIRFDSFDYAGVDPAAADAGANEYLNPILAGFYPDPSLCRVGNDYYLINSTFAYYPGIPIFHSTDLVNWRQLGHVIHRPEQLTYDRLGVSDGIFAPAITHHDGTFYVICTQVGGEGNFVVTATDPAGPWSDATQLFFEGIDPSIFFDDDGRAWVANNGAPEEAPLYNGHRAIWIQEFDPVEKKMIGPRKVLVNGGIDISQKPIWIEGPHIFKRDGWYYLCCAEGGTGPDHSQVVLRSRKVDGPYQPWEKNPILTQRMLNPNEPGAVTCTGHADLELGPDGKWWAVFLGVRPYEDRFSPMGRETFLLPVAWTDDGWPLILPADERVPLTGEPPEGVAVKRSESRPLNGTFDWRDDFTTDRLAPEWIMLRTPTEIWWKVDPLAGKLELTPRQEKLSGRGNPSYLARRVQHAQFEASLVVEPPEAPGVAAGLAVFQNERRHYFLAVRRDGENHRVDLERTNGRQEGVVASAIIPPADSIELHVAADRGTCSFSYRADGGEKRTLVEDADAKMLTSAVAGGFVGATVGPHVRTETVAAETATAAAESTLAVDSPLKGPLKWTSTRALILPAPDESHDILSVKDPTVVRYNDMWHVYATTASSQGHWSMVYLSFKDWSEATGAKPYYIDQNPGLRGYHCAPQVFYFPPHRKWYLIYQSQQPQYSMTDDLSQSETWTQPKDFFDGKPPGTPRLWIDYWVICDETHAYLFLTGDNGRLYRIQTSCSSCIRDAIPTAAVRITRCRTGWDFSRWTNPTTESSHLNAPYHLILRLTTRQRGVSVHLISRSVGGLT